MIVDIAEVSLEEVGQWSWPRTVFAQLIDRLAKMGAAVIAFDVIFAEPDRLSPSEFAATLDGVDPTIVASLRALPDNDTVMTETMQPHRVLMGQPASTDPPVQDKAASAPPMTVAEINGDPRPHLLKFAAWCAVCRSSSKPRRASDS